MDVQLDYLLDKLIQKSSIRIHREELKIQLKSHPSYPSLHALTGVLDHFSIPNLAARVPKSSEVLAQLPKYFICNIVLEEGEQLVLIEKSGEKMRIITNENTKKEIAKEAFLSKWTGVVLVIEKDQSISENRTGQFKKYLFYSLNAALITALGFALLKTNEIYPAIHVLLSLVGFGLSVLLVQHALGVTSKSTHNFCNFSEKTSCETVLNSKGAKVMGSFSLSDLSLVTFSIFILAWTLFLLTGTTSHTIFYVMGLFGVPVVVYSVYYQYKIVKTWCPLCLGVCAVLLGQFGILFTTSIPTTALPVDPTATILFAFSVLVIALSWTLLKPRLTKIVSLQKLELDHLKFKKNYTIFNTLLYQGKSLSQTDDVPGEIILGPDQAPIELTLATSPYCIFCLQAHKDLEKILIASKGQVRIRVRMRVDKEDRSSSIYKIASELLHIYNTKGKASCLLALQELYSDKANPEEWIKERTIHERTEYNNILNLQEDWFEENKVNFTPALFLFNKPFPKEYNRTDLLYFTEDIIEFKNQGDTSNKVELRAS